MLVFLRKSPAKMSRFRPAFVGVVPSGRVAPAPPPAEHASAAISGAQPIEAALVWIADVEHDIETRRKYKLVMAEHAQTPLAPAEEAIVTQAQELFESVETESMKSGQISQLRRSGVKPLAHASTVDAAWTRRDPQTGQVVGRAEVTISNASVQDVVAFLMDYRSRYFERMEDPASVLRNVILETVSFRHIVSCLDPKKTPTTFRPHLLDLDGVEAALCRSHHVHRCSLPTRDAPTVHAG